MVRSKSIPIVRNHLPYMAYRPPLPTSEPRISAAISTGYDGNISAWGSEQDACRPSIAHVPWPGTRNGFRVARLHPIRAEEVAEWQEDVVDAYLSSSSRDTSRERSLSPAVSEAALSTASIYEGAARGGSEVPEPEVVRSVAGRGRRGVGYYGGALNTVSEQGPAGEGDER